MSDKDRIALIAKIAHNAQEYYSESLDALCISLDVIEMIATDWGEEQLRNGCALRPAPESEKKRDGGSDEMKDAEKLALIRKLAERGREICDDPGLQVDTLLECVIMVIDAEEVIVE